MRRPSRVRGCGFRWQRLRDRGSNQRVEVTPAGVQSSFGTGLSVPIGIAVYEGKSGDEIFVSDAGNNRVVEFVP